MRSSTLVPLVLLATLWIGPASPAWAGAPRVLPEGERPKDARLEKLKDLNGYFPFEPCESPEAWAVRSERVRRQLLVALGLWPMPTKTDLDPVIHGRVERDEYTVEKVYFKSYPMFFVTGNLYRPKGRSGRLPGVLCPHGHWSNGRFHDHGEKKVREEIERGAEKFEVGGRHPIQARCVQLARMGCVVFQYDMVGYADSKQLPHRPGTREAMNTAENWGFESPQAELRMQTIMGLQAFDSIRALDFLCSLPDVDPGRIGVTGASGGGTQTFILAAIDPRPAVAFPAVMVSTAMQGGCTCENASYLRVGTGNVEIAALFSPKPLGLTAADDWTKEMNTKGFPELKRHYEMLGAGDRVMLESLTQFKHNYNYPSRAAMYRWFNEHLKLGYAAEKGTGPFCRNGPKAEKGTGPFCRNGPKGASHKRVPSPFPEERDYVPLSVEEMSVWDDEHPAPPGGEDLERELLRFMTEDAQRQLAALAPKDAASLAEYRRVVGGAVDVMIGRGLPGPDAIEIKPSTEATIQRDAYRFLTGTLDYPEKGEQLPVVVLMPPELSQWNKRMVVWIAPEGKQALFGEGDAPRPAVAKLIEAGFCVLGVDLFGQGEFTEDGKPLEQQRLVRRDKEGRPGYAGYTFGYNAPLFSKRVHDVLSVISWAKHGKGSERAEAIDLVGLGGAGHWVAAARAQAGDAIDRAVIDTAGFRFANLTSIDDPDFLPGAVKYGDLPAMLALSAPHPLWLAGEGGETPRTVEAAYQAAGKRQNLVLFDGPEERAEKAVVNWLLGE